LHFQGISTIIISDYKLLKNTTKRLHMLMHTSKRLPNAQSQYDEDSWSGLWVLIFGVWRSSKSNVDLQLPSSFLLIQGVEFWLTFLQIFWLISCACDTLIHVQTLFNFNLWFCTLEHILANPIVLQYFVIIKTLEKLYKNQICSNRRHY